MRLMPLLPLLLACSSAAPEPWQPGELVIEQLDLPASSIGEAALVVGPDGTTVLIDTGNDSHADEVREALQRHRGGLAVDWIALTHYHADHIGGFDALVTPGGGEDAVDVAGGVVWRGRWDLRPDGANPGEFEEVCSWLEGHPEREVALCSGAQAAPCDFRAGEGPWPAEDCAALPYAIPLGDGAELVLFAADGFAVGEGGVIQGEEPGDRLDDPGENARSLVGVVRHGDFAYVFAGDLTGGSKDTPDVESFVAGQGAAAGHPVPAGAVDVVKLSHHGIASSSHEAWVAWLLPDDGHTRHAVVSANGAYAGAPAGSVLERVGARLGGGSIWATRKGAFAGSDDSLVVAHGAVLVRVAAGGGRYRVEAGGDPVEATSIPGD